MTTQFALDLRLARRKSGLTGRDLAHLLHRDPGTLSTLEHGKRLPTLFELCTLSLIYGRTFEALYGELFGLARRVLTERLGTLPPLARATATTHHRAATIARLAKRLADEQNRYGT
jgi:transcriptional regulator with XRE-family HTH domain